MEGEIRERELYRGEKVAESLGCVMKGRTEYKEIKRTLRDNIIIPILMNAEETWTWAKM